MCTAIRLTTRDHYFGRNLDLEYSYQETVAITPRHYPFHFRHEGTNSDHFAMIGMAFVAVEIFRYLIVPLLVQLHIWTGGRL